MKVFFLFFVISRPAKLRFDYAVRISAAEVLRKKDANQTTHIFAKNSLNKVGLLQCDNHWVELSYVGFSWVKLSVFG